ncbi:unnamed protein product [Adineta ricciae]|uniref:Uncharacterized protein n=1 Tax=Adineta ricciae TaxID=249248 RepID=A0A815BUR6_ADIRI|nr:unnamed protein product [Adineta ricciae]
MQIFNFYCLLLCSMVIFAVHQINASERLEETKSTISSEITATDTPEKTLTLRDVLFQGQQDVSEGDGPLRTRQFGQVSVSNGQTNLLLVSDGSVPQCGKGQVSLSQAAIICK